MILTCPAPAESSGAALPHLTINIELETAVFANLPNYRRNGLDVPLFSGELTISCSSWTGAKMETNANSLDVNRRT